MQSLPHGCEQFLSRAPLRLDGDVLDYVGSQDDYVDNYETIASDDLEKRFTPDDVRDVLRNLCEVMAIPEGVTVDIGCADGLILRSLSARTRIAVDIAATYLRILSGVDFKLRANAEDLPLADAVADTVVCTDVFEHVQDEKALADQLIRILKPGGRLLLATPWMQNLSVYETPEYISRYKKYKFVHLRSVDTAMISSCFGGLRMIGATTIRIGMKLMELEPYPIRFMCFTKD